MEMVDAGHDREPRVSVVVPIYNSEKYLSDDGMLHSLLAQTLTEIEIVLVDDGSSDNSLAICREYAYRDDRISVISRANGGEAAARNTGIIAATGDYVLVVDHDDRLEPNALEVLHDLAVRFETDVVRCNFRTIRSGGGLSPTRALHPYREFLGREYIRAEILPSMVGIVLRPEKQLPGHWTYLIRRQLLVENAIRYDETKRKETDHRFIIEVLNVASSIVLTEDYLYNFIKRKGSNTSTSYSPRFDNIMDNLAHYESILGDELDFNTKDKVTYNVFFVQECVRYVLLHEREVADKRQEIVRILCNSKVTGWYQLLQPTDLFTSIIRRCVAAGKYDLAYLLFEAAFLKTRVRRLLPSS